MGVVGHGYVVARPFGDLPVAGTPRSYVDVLDAVGARPVLLPGRHAAGLLDLVDAIVLTGGGDLDPALHGGDPATAHGVDRERDDHELALVEAAARTRTPLLGVCRGAQLLAVAFGGRLVGGVGHLHPCTGHPVRSREGSLVSRLLGDRFVSSALHQQAVSDAGPCWTPTAWTADGTIEAIEWRAGDWPVLGVQWHPELGADDTGAAIFGWLCGVASGGGSGRARVSA